jgi:hypothetical protein
MRKYTKPLIALRINSTVESIKKDCLSIKQRVCHFTTKNISGGIPAKLTVAAKVLTLFDG